MSDQEQDQGLRDAAKQQKGSVVVVGVRHSASESQSAEDDEQEGDEDESS